jgi:outer membrane protein assembly factor BamB
MMLGKAVALLALAASCLGAGVPPSLAGGKNSQAATAQSGWYSTDSNAAHSRANLAEKVLAPSSVPKVKYLRSVVAPPTSPGAPCGPARIAAPLPFGGYLYSVVNSGVNKYNPATGHLIWQRKLSRYTLYKALAISGNRIIVAGTGCTSASEPGGLVYALNASTGAVLWTNDGVIDDAVKVGSYVITAGWDATGYTSSVLKLSDGTPVWSTSAGCATNVPDPALVVGLVVMTYGCDSQGIEDIEARNLATGAVAWSRPAGWTLQRGDLGGSAGKHLYARNPSATVVALNPLTGQKEYSLRQAVNVLAVPASRIYAACGSQGQYVCAYNINTGALEWQDTPPYAQPAGLRTISTRSATLLHRRELRSG